MRNGIGGGEHAVDEAGHDQERGEILRHLVLYHLPARDDNKDGDETVEQDEQHRNTVDAQRIVNIEAFDPGSKFTELQRRGRRIEPGIKRDAYQEAEHRAGERHPARRPFGLLVAEDQHQNAEQDRHPDREAENRQIL